MDGLQIGNLSLRGLYRLRSAIMVFKIGKTFLPGLCGVGPQKWDVQQRPVLCVCCAHVIASMAWRCQSWKSTAGGFCENVAFVFFWQYVYCFAITGLGQSLLVQDFFPHQEGSRICPYHCWLSCGVCRVKRNSCLVFLQASSWTLQLLAVAFLLICQQLTRELEL